MYSAVVFSQLEPSSYRRAFDVSESKLSLVEVYFLFLLHFRPFWRLGGLCQYLGFQCFGQFCLAIGHSLEILGIQVALFALAFV